MVYIENNFLSQQSLATLYYHWFINIDDIFLIWSHPVSEFYNFIDKMNQIHPTIHELSREIITFLDTNIHLDNNKLFVTTHIKSTNKQAYTNASSYHPPETGKGIAIGKPKCYARTNTHLANFQNQSLNTFNKWQWEVIYNLDAIKTLVDWHACITLGILYYQCSIFHKVHTKFWI